MRKRDGVRPVVVDGLSDHRYQRPVNRKNETASITRPMAMAGTAEAQALDFSLISARSICTRVLMKSLSSSLKLFSNFGESRDSDPVMNIVSRHWTSRS